MPSISCYENGPGSLPTSTRSRSWVESPVRNRSGEPVVPSILFERLAKIQIKTDFIMQMSTHSSILPLVRRVMHNLAFAWYVSQEHPNCKGKTDFTVAAFLVFNYLEFVYLMKTKLADDRYTQLSGPPILVAVWHDHVRATNGYQDFCEKHVGAMLHHEVGRVTNVPWKKDYHRCFEIARAIYEYTEWVDGGICVQRLLENGIWWPEVPRYRISELCFPFAIRPLLSATTEEDAKEIKKRARCSSVENSPIRPHTNIRRESVQGLAAEEGSKRAREEPLRIYVKTLTGKALTCNVNYDLMLFDPVDEVESPYGVFYWKMAELCMKA
ncbi:hypothetical protein CYMTET_3919 [Cymbomonas tetramitiformis]|uniref:Uncharacterized protein n=1 Tax=Cymbomonas tetramitiformis TaxID=36881 RepID=A0AAE0H262_9CHLO|nr:hypothetical protein CYMTET_3919 [Cymbomonas tetramitiformis]